MPKSSASISASVVVVVIAMHFFKTQKTRQWSCTFYLLQATYAPVSKDGRARTVPLRTSASQNRSRAKTMLPVTTTLQHRGIARAQKSKPSWLHRSGPSWRRCYNFHWAILSIVYYILINLSHLNSSYHYGTYCQYTDLCITEGPCQNGGDCVTSAGDYSCQCAQGYDDRNCSTELYCITQNVTCENNVTCTNQDGEYVWRQYPNPSHYMYTHVI